MESGIDESAVRKFPGGEVTVGSAASGAGDNREIPVEEGGDINRATGQYVFPGPFSNSRPQHKL